MDKNQFFMTAEDVQDDYGVDLITAETLRNGFIEAMVSGTTNEGKGYQYFGDRAYVKWIQGN